MTQAEVLIAVKEELNRPVDDDKFPPGRIYRSMTRITRRLRNFIAIAEPELIDKVESSVSANDATGQEYDLAVIPVGGVRVFTPPGPPGGIEILPSHLGKGHGFVLAGLTVRLEIARVYSPGLYVRYVEPIAAITATVPSGGALNTLLPDFFHDALILGVAWDMASTPNSNMNAAELKGKFDDEFAEIKKQRRMKMPARPLNDAADAETQWYVGMAK